MRFFTQPNRLWSHWLILAATACLAVFVWKAASDEPPAAARQPAVPIALLDVAKVFKEFRAFNAEMNRIKAEIDEFEQEVRASQVEINRLGKESSADGSGKSAEDVAKLATDLQAKVTAKRVFFLAEEAQVYFDAYNRIEEQTKRLASERDIGVVLRSQFEPMNPADRESVLKGVNRVVIHSTAPDLTADVLAALNK
jgi:Skp family chaperone for outer membrane proteins